MISIDKTSGRCKIKFVVRTVIFEAIKFDKFLDQDVSAV